MDLSNIIHHKVYFNGQWIRRNTYDRMIAIESYKYASLTVYPRDIFLDIGANIGCVTLRLLELGVSRAICVEPDSDNFLLLLENVSPYPGRTLAINAAASGQSNSTARLWLNSGRNKGMHSTSYKAGGRFSTVPAIHILSLLEEHKPTILKIDIEGGEYELFDCFSSIPDYIRIIAIELHFFENDWRLKASDIVEMLTSSGFAPEKQPKIIGKHPCNLSFWTRLV